MTTASFPPLKTTTKLCFFERSAKSSLLATEIPFSHATDQGSLVSCQDVIACDVVDPDDINVDFSCVGGLDDVKSALKELVVLPLKVCRPSGNGNVCPYAPAQEGVRYVCGVDGKVRSPPV